MARRVLMIGLAICRLIQETGVIWTGDSSRESEDLTCFLQSSIKIHHVARGSRSQLGSTSDVVVHTIIHTAVNIHESLPASIRKASAILLLSVGNHCRRLSASGLGLSMGLLTIFGIMVGMLACWFTIYGSKAGHTMARAEFDSQFETDHVHWKSPAASLAGSPQKPPSLTRLKMPMRPESQSRIRSYRSLASSSQGSSSYIAASIGDPLNRSAALARSAQYVDISTPRASNTSPYATLKRWDDPNPALYSVSSLQSQLSQPRVSVEPRTQALFVSSGARSKGDWVVSGSSDALPKGDWQPTSRIVEEERSSLGGIQNPPITRAPQQIPLQGPINDELQALLQERRKIADAGSSSDLRPPMRTPREIVRDVNLRRSEAEEEMMSRIQRMN